VFFTFDEAVFEPKPVQKPWPPILVGGESKAALRRAARLGDGWIGMGHTFDTAKAQIKVLRSYLDANNRSHDGFQIVLGGPVTSRADVAQWEEIGVTRLIVSPWRRSPEAVEGLKRFAEFL
jgi:alkanesulfonate monooxygenase SsuD/methylene tetrahydromethanopterin reductase-like flavin-dependent oxidoreductase (luciferase family)